jgi:peptidoglycan/LPS O-acetylase OafA/YrhL
MSVNFLDHSLAVALIYTVSIYLIVVAFSSALVKFNSSVASALVKDDSRYGCIDGLRGLLALGVLIHHSYAAFGYFTTEKWIWSDSALLNHLGSTSVAVFFMITAFLFTSRLISGKPIVWSSLFLTRMARLAPLYVVFVGCATLSVFYFSEWHVREPLSKLAAEVANWLAFVVFSRPDINAMPETWTLVAGVNWSLKYEWLFYLCLPLLYHILQPFNSCLLSVLGAGLFLLAGVMARYVNPYLLHFSCGIAIALLYRDPLFHKITATKWFRILALACLISLLFFKNSSTIPALLVAVTFASVVGGDSIGGILRWKGVKWLGEISYGVYLIHGLVLYWTLAHLKRHVSLTELNVFAYWTLIGALGVVVVSLSSLAHFAIEIPGIRAGKRVSRMVARSKIPAPSGVKPIPE